MKKKVAITGMILLAVAYIIFCVISYAGSEVIYVGLNTTHHNGEGYGIGNPKSGGLGIWNLRNYYSADRDNESSEQKELYCLKGDYGDSWEQNSAAVIEYNLTYDLDTEREKLLQLLGGENSDANTVVTNILSDSTTGIYKELLWVIDNAFIPGKSDKEQLLKKIGILYDSDSSLYYYEPVDGYDYSDKINNWEWVTTLTETDIKAVQQAVIWYFTNAKLDNDSTFDKTNATDWLTITVDDGSTYTQLIDYKQSTEEGAARYDQANILYNYLINSAIKNADNYTSSGYQKPVEVDLTGLTSDADGKYEIESNRNGDNYITGPIKIAKNNELNYEITLKITNATTGTEISSSNYIFTDVNGTSLETTDVTTLIVRTDGFYISIPKTVAKEVDIDITINYTAKNKSIWLSGTENGTTSVTLNAEQPVLEVEEELQTESVKFIAIPKEFDLALRKYITQVNGTNVTDSRVPNISETTLETGTTATYNHRKDPVVVKNGDIVTYKITIYNEGNKNGYATEITDQLPTGLKYAGGSTITSNKNAYNVTYNSSTNQITFVSTTSTALNAYEANSLDSETLEFTCEVTANPDTDNDKILTNVAWISGAYDSDSSKDITSIGDDRDSRPQTYPSIDKDSMESYKGNSSNKTDLTDSTYYYQGEQDDDDFEKLLIEPETSITVTKTWDDNSNQDGIRPASIDVSLYADGTAVSGKTATLSNSNSWTYTFTGLPVKSNGTAISYTVEETSEITGYDASVNGFTITNTHEPETTDISVEKVWDDSNDQDGIRPTSITVRLLKGGVAVTGKTAILNSTNSWKYTFTDLPKYENGQEIQYTVEETSIPTGYTSETPTGDMTNGFTITNTHNPEKIFDLALRKYITKINNNELTTLGLSSRVPNISETTLQSGTTATYKHRKDPVAVEEGDIVTYEITIYNEGEKAGYAKQIIDQLPTGLIYNPSSTVVSTDSNGTEKNTYTVTYDTTTNKITFDIVNTTENSAEELNAYEKGNLDSETIELKCKVTYKAQAGKSNILTNVAWINEAFNTSDNVKVANVGNDRDSEPGTKPNVNKDNMENYKGNDNNKNDLTDSSYYYEGEQDDDDFEKLYVKTFDLSLRKFVSTVNGEEPEQSREPEVDVTPLKDKTGTTAIYKHPKTPVSLKTGDTVIYTIRVYNEGEVDGYASEVTDYLPPYLEYVENSTINNKYGW